MKITVGQFSVKSKDIEYNFKQISDLVNTAKEANFDVIVFGEYALSGYACGDYFSNKDFINTVIDYQYKINHLSNDIIIIFGGLTYLNDKLFNTAIVCNKGEIFNSHKDNLSKREFNEKKYFFSKENQVVTLNNQDYLITFKSDLSNINKFKYDHLIVLDSSAINDNISLNLDFDHIYANTIGISAIDKVVFINTGKSYVKKDNTLYTFKNSLDVGIIKELNELSLPSKLEAITFGIKTFSDQTFNKNKKWVIGSSGGLDSAVTTALLTIALGRDNVITYNLASKYNQDLTINNAKSLAEKLNIKHFENSIEPLLVQTYKTLNEFGYGHVSGFDQENIQARTRGHLLASFAALESAVICNNSNKLELALGYATMYGDTIGALSVIGDLSKVEVFDLALEINEYYKEDVIPINLLPKVTNYTIDWIMPPSAELKENQTDPMKWFYHDLLLGLILKLSAEDILEKYLHNQFKGLEIGKWLSFYNLDKPKNFLEDFKWFKKTMEINQFKRLQTPPVLAYTNQVISKDFIESSNIVTESKRFKKLENAILEKYKQ